MPSSIEWTEETWNPLAGCDKIAPGCKHCYAIRTAHRLAGNPNPKIAAAYAGLTVIQNGAPNWTGRINLLPDRLDVPLRTRKPTTYFVNSMSDLFHKDVPDYFIDRVIAAMAMCERHRFIVLTKRGERMADYMSAIHGRLDEINTLARCLTEKPFFCPVVHSGRWPLPNVILGVSASDQKTLDEQAPHLLRTPAACRVLSLEPLLGPVDLTEVRRQLTSESYEITSCLEGNDGFGQSAARNRIDWVIVGGESGPGARPCNVQWIRDIVRQCQAAIVPCFVKQLGSWPVASFTAADIDAGKIPDEDIRYIKDKKGGDMSEWPQDLRVRELPEVLR